MCTIQTEPLVCSRAEGAHRLNLVHVELAPELHTAKYDGAEFSYPVGVGAELSASGYRDVTAAYANRLEEACSSCAREAPEVDLLEAGWWEHRHKPGDSPLTSVQARATATAADPFRTPFDRQYVVGYCGEDAASARLYAATPTSAAKPPGALLETVFRPKFRLYFSGTDVLYLAQFGGDRDRYRIPAERSYTPDDGWHPTSSVDIVGDFSAAVIRFGKADTIVPATGHVRPDGWAAGPPADPEPFT